MANRYVGSPVDSFFLRYGPPASSYTMQDGRKMYVWAENAKHLTFTGVSTAQVNVIGNTAYVTGMNTPSSTVDIQCQVRIVADQQGRIQQILSHADSVGYWQTSRCNEIFGK